MGLSVGAVSLTGRTNAPTVYPLLVGVYRRRLIGIAFLQ